MFNIVENQLFKTKYLFCIADCNWCTDITRLPETVLLRVKEGLLSSCEYTSILRNVSASKAERVHPQCPIPQHISGIPNLLHLSPRAMLNVRKVYSNSFFTTRKVPTSCAHSSGSGSRPAWIFSNMSVCTIVYRFDFQSTLYCKKVKSARRRWEL